jgi:hypothetical protein
MAKSKSKSKSPKSAKKGSLKRKAQEEPELVKADLKRFAGSSDEEDNHDDDNEDNDDDDNELDQIDEMEENEIGDDNITNKAVDDTDQIGAGGGDDADADVEVDDEEDDNSKENDNDDDDDDDDEDDVVEEHASGMANAMARILGTTMTTTKKGIPKSKSSSDCTRCSFQNNYTVATTSKGRKGTHQGSQGKAKNQSRSKSSCLAHTLVGCNNKYQHNSHHYHTIDSPRIGIGTDASSCRDTWCGGTLQCHCSTPE